AVAFLVAIAAAVAAVRVSEILLTFQIERLAVADRVLAIAAAFAISVVVGGAPHVVVRPLVVVGVRRTLIHPAVDLLGPRRRAACEKRRAQCEDAYGHSGCSRLRHQSREQDSFPVPFRKNARKSEEGVRQGSPGMDSYWDQTRTRSPSRPLWSTISVGPKRSR